MADECNIKDFQVLLKPILQPNEEVVNFKAEPLIAPGENYGSLMLAVEVQVKSKNKSTTSVLNVIAKLCPPNEWIKKMFNIPVTFKKEIAMYNTIIPTLKQFQRDQGVINVFNSFPICYGARVSLDPQSEAVDDDAVLLLENLKLAGYETVDRMAGFNLDATEVILKDLAVFHAIPLAIKLLKADVFAQKIMPHLYKFKAFEAVSENVEKGMQEALLDAAGKSADCVPLLPRVQRSIEQAVENWKNKKSPREPFATLCHNDFWVNNTMVKFENGRTTGNKIIDFQIIDYDSPAKDVVFFLFSSVQKQVLDAHYNSLIKLYYDTFINTLQHLKCNISPFTFEAFQEEINLAASASEFFHVLIMLRPMYSVRGKIKELKELSESDMLTNDQLSDLYQKRLVETILDFAKRNWI